MITNFGKFLRKLRVDHNEFLKDMAALTRFIQKHIKNRHVRGFYLDSFTKNGLHTMHWINSRQDCYVLGAQIAYTLRNHPVYTLIYKLYIHEKAYGYVFPRIPERKHL